MYFRKDCQNSWNSLVQMKTLSYKKTYQLSQNKMEDISVSKSLSKCWMNISIKTPINNYSNYQHLLCHKESILMNSTIWDVTKYSPVKVQWCFGGMYCLHHQDWRVSKTSKKPAWSKWYAEHWWTYTALHGIISRRLYFW